ncbi:MAG: efflux RND transporter permease subunit [Elusimicrobia bacterium]|nr:efflux RND transporter permease subunit [Elusimicrobiota bacterium]
MPDTNNQVQVNTAVEGLTPEEIERYITVPIENGMGGLADLLQTRSISRFGLSQVTLVFEDRVDIYRARQVVSERPGGVIPAAPRRHPARPWPWLQHGPGRGLLTLSKPPPPAVGAARIAQLMELKSIQDWYLKPRSLTVPGGRGQQHRRLRETVSRPTRHPRHGPLRPPLRRPHRGPREHEPQRGRRLRPADGRAVPCPGHRPFRKRRGCPPGPHQVPGNASDHPHRRRGQGPPRHGLRTGAAPGERPEDIVGTARMRLGENSRVVAHRVAEKVAEVKKGLPEGVVLNVLYDRSVLVDATLGTVKHNLVTGAVLVIVILVLLLGNFRAALITAVTIPLTLLITFIVMKRLGMSGNLMSLGALDFGIIVDGVVIVIDNCVRRVHHHSQELRRALKKDELSRTIEEATLEIRQSAGFGQLIIVVVFLPIFAFTGVEGKMFVPMVGSFCIALMAAFVLSFTLAPALASLFPQGGRGGEGALAHAPHPTHLCPDAPKTSEIPPRGIGVGRLLHPPWRFPLHTPGWRVPPTAGRRLPRHPVRPPRHH